MIPEVTARARVAISADRRMVLAGGAEFLLPAGAILNGDLNIAVWDGPFGIREYEFPSFLRVRFTAVWQSLKLDYKGELTPFDLCPHKGEQCVSGDGFAPSVGPTQWMYDRDDTVMVVAVDGSPKPLVRKLMDSRIELMLKDASAVIKLRYHDQTKGDYDTLFIERPIESLLFLRVTKLFRDAQGNIEDFDPHGEQWVDMTASP